MRIFVHVLVHIILLIKSIESLTPLLENSDSVDKYVSKESLRNLVDTLAKIKSSRRRINAANLEKAKNFFKKLTKNMSPAEVKSILRQNEDTEVVKVEPEIIGVNQEQAKLVETELTEVLNKKSSALLDRPYVQKTGRNDFLVMRPDVKDSFVTVIPNAIYYNIEKKCVNWLDDCSLQGIRARLLQSIQSPYK